MLYMYAAICGCRKWMANDFCTKSMEMSLKHQLVDVNSSY